MLEEALEHLVKGIVDHPEDVTVDLLTNRRGKTLEIRVHPDDLGKVIGRGGRTAKALRQVMTGVGGLGLRVDVVAGNPSAVDLADALAAFAAERRDGLVAAGEPVVKPSLRMTSTRRRV